MPDQRKVQEALRAIQSRDPQLARELDRRLEAASREVALFTEGRNDALAGLTPETIVLRTGRPVLAIKQDEVSIDIQDPDSEVWRERLQSAVPKLAVPIRGVGRVEVQGHPSFTWLGTGWLVRPDILVTNRHVAAEFTRRSGEGFRFRLGTGQRAMTANVDFLEEIDSNQSRPFELRDVLHVEDEDGPDLAFFRVGGGGLSDPVALSETGTSVSSFVAAIGYPARDSRIPEQDLMDRLFGNVYDKKRLAPGQVMSTDGGLLRHDCSTLGGSSGSLLVDLKSGNAVGIHFAGRFLEANYAVPADVVAEHLHAVERGGVPRQPGPRAKAAGEVGSRPAAPGTVSVTVPLHITLRIGETGEASVVAATSTTRLANVGADASGGADEIDFVTERRPEDYADRRGYQHAFLGHGLEVDMPRVVRGREQTLTFPDRGNDAETVLRYHNFSVTMHKTRRMCFFSAVNIDGNQSRKTKRPGWTLDPRIPKEYQILAECYGNPPKFSRGHMTRREDPAWGSPEAAHLGNADSMHVTNAVPQMQSFNAGIWLGLEDYALENAREDDMKICVFTGPILRANDPERYGVKIPVQFWKVIAFLHDETGELSATGYSISQEKFLSDQEFVFGAYETHQRSLAWIEDRAGVSLGSLREHDRFAEQESMIELPLLDPGQIRWR